MNHNDDDIEISELIPDEKDIEVFVNKTPAISKKETARSIKKIDFTSSIDIDEDKNIDKDYKIAHENLQTTLEIAANAVQELEDLARSSAHPRVYEVLNGFLKTIESTSKSLLELNKQKQELKKSVDQSKSTEGTNNTTVTNNTLIVTTKELSEIVQNAIKKSN